MITQNDSGVKPGNSWTMNQERQDISEGKPGRLPYIEVRDVDRPQDWEVWLGTPGITMNFSRDGTQMANIIYGDGTSVDGTTWRNAVLSINGARTDYRPLAWDDRIWPYTNNKSFASHAFAAEAYLKFGTGFSQSVAHGSAEKTLQRDLDPGWTGSMTLSINPQSDVNKWQIRAGHTVKVRGIAGTGEGGIRFHIAEVNCSPQDGTVALTLDSKYRDLLNLEEAMSRTRDPLTPVKMLQTNKTSVMIEDIQAPWDYNAGSGLMPLDSKNFWFNKPRAVLYPYASWLKSHPPSKYPQYYAHVNANATARKDRWTRIPVLTSEKGTIRRTEVICVDHDGNILRVPYHLSIYYINVTPSAMPRDGDGPSPFIDNAFTSINPTTGQPWVDGDITHGPDPSYIIGWGGRINGHYNRAGFWPGSETAGHPVTGLFVDEEPWSFDNHNNANYDPNKSLGQKQDVKGITLYVMFYCVFTQDVYFVGRLWRQEPGVG
jgi:hypothetical protein